MQHSRDNYRPRRYMALTGSVLRVGSEVGMGGEAVAGGLAQAEAEDEEEANDSIQSYASGNRRVGGPSSEVRRGGELQGGS